MRKTNKLADAIRGTLYFSTEKLYSKAAVDVAESLQKQFFIIKKPRRIRPLGYRKFHKQMKLRLQQDYIERMAHYKAVRKAWELKNAKD